MFKALTICALLLFTPNVGRDKIKGVYAGIFVVPARGLGSNVAKHDVMFNMQHVPFAYDAKDYVVITTNYGNNSAQWEIDIDWDDFVKECTRTYHK